MGTVIENKEYRLIFDDIPLHEESIKIINYVKTMYKEVEADDFRVIKNPIVHLYPLKDTMNEAGQLDGFNEALFFKTKIFNPEDFTYSICENDSVDTLDAQIKRIKIFKDGSTMIEFEGEYRLSNNTGLTLYKTKKTPSLEPDSIFD